MGYERGTEQVQDLGHHRTAPAFAVAAGALGLLIAFPTSPAQASKAQAAEPLKLVVDLSKQRVRAYRGTESVWSSRISSGKRGHRTPTGVFSIIQKRRRHFSNLYNNAPMPHMQRLTWSGIAFHGGPIPGYPASHGCIRLPYGKARQLFKMTRMNSTRVVVTYGAPRPQTIAHPLLWNRLPPGDDAPAGSDPNADPENERVATGVTADERASLLNTVIGITSAEAAPFARPAAEVSGSSIATTRAEVTRQLTARLEQAKQEQERLTAGVNHARVTSAQATKDLRVATTTARKVKIARAKAQREAVALQRKLDAATVRLRKLMVASVDVEPELADFDELAAHEGKLEAEIAELSADLRLANAHVDELGQSLIALEHEWAGRKAAFDLAREEAREIGRAAVAAQKDVKRLTHMIARHDLPVHVLVSRTKSKVFVRQGYKDIYEADVTFREPDQPLGTHVMTAVSEAEDRTALRWSVITVPDRKFSEKGAPAKSPEAALDRVVMSPETHRVIRELVKVGSSLIVSDRGPSRETGKGTDLIVATR